MQVTVFVTQVYCYASRGDRVCGKTLLVTARQEAELSGQLKPIPRGAHLQNVWPRPSMWLSHGLWLHTCGDLSST